MASQPLFLDHVIFFFFFKWRSVYPGFTHYLRAPRPDWALAASVSSLQSGNYNSASLTGLLGWSTEENLGTGPGRWQAPKYHCYSYHISCLFGISWGRENGESPPLRNGSTRVNTSRSRAPGTMIMGAPVSLLWKVTGLWNKGQDCYQW